MINHIILSYQKFFFDKIEKFTSKKNWEILLSITLPFIVLLFAFPSYDRIDIEFNEAWNAIFKQVENPLKDYGYDPYSHEAKTCFRLFVPLMIKLLHLNTLGTLILQGIFGIFLFYMTTRIFIDITKDKVTAMLLTIGLAFIWTGKTNYIEIRAMFDGIAIFFLVFSIFFRHPILIFLGVFLSAWTDERGLIASSLVFLYWSFVPQQKLSLFNKQTISVILAWVFYFGIRYYLSATYNLSTYSDFVGFKVLREQINNIPIGTWTALEGFWIIVILSLLLLIKNKQSLFNGFLFMAMSVILIVALSVHDITRSMAYIFPAVFISISVINTFESKENLRKLVLFTTSMSFIFPAYDITGDYYINWTYPFPLQVLRFIFGTGEVLGNI